MTKALADAKSRRAIASLCKDPEWNRRVANVLLRCIELRDAQSQSTSQTPEAKNPLENTMTLVLELPANIESDFRRVATQKGVSLQEAAQIAVSDWTARNQDQRNSEAHRAAVEAAFGCAKTETWLDDAMRADFNAEKREDIERENARDLI